jgi:translation initiation factor 2 beta subunit (eIF-2beta)/eIF-5
MIRLIRFLITGSWHEHKWEMKEKHTTDVYLNDDDVMPYKTERLYIQKCSVCGKLKAVKVSG